MTNKEKYRKLQIALAESGYSIEQHTYTDAGITYYWITVAAKQGWHSSALIVFQQAQLLFPHAHEITINGLHGICLYEQLLVARIAVAASVDAAAHMGKWAKLLD